MCEVCETDASAASLTRALNELQAFNIIPDDLSVIYVHGRAVGLDGRWLPVDHPIGRGPSAILSNR
jgi:hypothetical protein